MRALIKQTRQAMPAMAAGCAVSMADMCPVISCIDPRSSEAVAARAAQGGKFSPAPSLLPDHEGMATHDARDVVKTPHSPYASPAHDGGTLAYITSFKRHPTAPGGSEGYDPMATPRVSSGV